MYEQRHIRLRKGKEDNDSQTSTEKCHDYEDPANFEATYGNETADDGSSDGKRKDCQARYS